MQTTDAPRSFSWTGRSGNYPPYVNITGNRLTVRECANEGAVSGRFLIEPGLTVCVDLPGDALISLFKTFTTDDTTALRERVHALEEQIATYEEAMRDMLWITSVIQDSLDVGWRARDGAAAIVNGFESVIADTATKRGGGR